MFCVMRRETLDQNLSRDEDFKIQNRLTADWLSLAAAQFQELVTLTFANTLQAFPGLSWSGRRNCRDYLRPFRRKAITTAQWAFDELDARWWEFWK
jgi:hypothetical protein